VVFHALGEEYIANIARIQLHYLEQRVAQMDMKLEVSDAAL
jgi:ATP-dependent Clp protease ATP-binding subunit ClpB